mmetsp:Transcript_28099/g.94649  ORF Transcript_28099/g.94649 Transcript_28099/m.94649 type:complete len:233 (-) Transcript_28099:85-783(-)
MPRSMARPKSSMRTLLYASSWTSTSAARMATSYLNLSPSSAIASSPGIAAAMSSGRAAAGVSSAAAACDCCSCSGMTSVDADALPAGAAASARTAASAAASSSPSSSRFTGASALTATAAAPSSTLTPARSRFWAHLFVVRGITRVAARFFAAPSVSSPRANTASGPAFAVLTSVLTENANFFAAAGAAAPSAASMARRGGARTAWNRPRQRAPLEGRPTDCKRITQAPPDR